MGRIFFDTAIVEFHRKNFLRTLIPKMISFSSEAPTNLHAFKPRTPKYEACILGRPVMQRKGEASVDAFEKQTCFSKLFDGRPLHIVPPDIKLSASASFAAEAARVKRRDRMVNGGRASSRRTRRRTDASKCIVVFEVF